MTKQLFRAHVQVDFAMAVVAENEAEAKAIARRYWLEEFECARHTVEVAVDQGRLSAEWDDSLPYGDNSSKTVSEWRAEGADTEPPPAEKTNPVASPGPLVADEDAEECCG